MKEQTLVYIVIGSAVIGVAYYLWKQEQAPPPQTSSLFAPILNQSGTALGSAASWGLTGLENIGMFF